MLYVFGDYTFDTQRYELRRAGKRVPLEPKAFDVLAYLIAHRDRVVTRHELLEQVWPRQFISDASLTSRLRAARQGVGDSGRAQRCIQTLHGRGYRFVAPVEERGHDSPEHPPPSASSTPDVSTVPAQDHGSAAAPHAEPAAEEPSHPVQRPVAGEYKPVTVLVCTLADAPGLAVRLGPEAMHRVMQTFAALALEEIQRYGATLHRQLDDGVVALFGAPVAQEDHALRAVRMAVALQERLRQQQVDGELPYKEELPVCMGLHTGVVIVEPLGAEGHLTVTAVRDTIRHAVDLQRLATPSMILLSESTAQRVQNDVRVEAVWPLSRSRKPTVFPAYIMRGIRPQRAPLAARVLTQFVGRTQELTALHTLLAQVEGGRGQVVGIVGDPGLGKSRLVYEFRRHQHGTPVTYLAGHCVSYGGATPYLPIQGLLRDACGITEADSPEAVTEKAYRSLRNLGMDPEDGAPYLLQVLGITGGTEPLTTLSPEMLKIRTFATLRQMSLISCRQRALIIEVENLHWIDPTSEEYLTSLVEGLAGVPLLLLVTYRPGYQLPWMEKSYATQLVLQPLGFAESRTVVQAVCGTTRVPEALTQAILTKAEGNPFFLEELARTMLEQGEGHTISGLPDTIQAVLAARIDRLPPEAKRLLQVAAVIGKDVPMPLLQEVAEVTEEGLEGGLKHLQAAEFLYETSLFPECVYTFKHALTHEVAYGSLLQGQRRVLHARIVETLETLGGNRLTDQVEQLAHHALQGEVWDKALMYYRQAGAKAAGRSAYREAVVCFERALGALKHLPESRDTLEQAIDLRLDLRNAFLPLGEHARILDYLREAETLVADLSDLRRQGRIAALQTFSFLTTGVLDRAIDCGQHALTLAESLGDLALRVVAHLRLNQIYYALGDYHRARDLCRKNVELLQGDLLHERFGLTGAPSVNSRTYLAWCCAELGAFAEGIATGEEGVRIAEALNYPFTLVYAYVGLGGVYLRKGDLPRAISMLERGLGISQAANLPLWLPLVSAALGVAYALSGRLAEALPLIEQAVERLSNRPGTGYISYGIRLGEVYLLARRIDDAMQVAQRALTLSRDHKQQGQQAYALRLLGDIAPHCDPPEVEQAAAHYQQALALANELGMRPLQAHCHRGLGTLYSQTGELEQARAELSTAIDMYRDMEMTFWLPETEATLAQLRSSLPGLPGNRPSRGRRPSKPLKRHATPS